MELFNPNSNIDFMRWRKVSLAISAILMVISAAIIFMRGLDYGLDFTGGANIEVSYEKAVDVAEVRAALTAGGFDNAVVQTFGGTNDFAIRIVSEEEASSKTEEASNVANDKIAVEVLKALQAKRVDAKVKSSEFVGPQIGEELRSDGLVAVIFVIAGISIYLWIRFEWRFAVSAVASEVHDTLLTVAAFALTGREFDLPALAAVLSVVGYSINDKIVVFDRVREIFRSSRKGEPAEILNRSINSTMSRTIMTGVTTALAVGTLYFLGGAALENFGLIMLIGIAIGIASSVFFANPVLLLLGVSKQDLMPKSKDDPELARRP
ncbi:MAG: protein translocase subunit SecF [Dokdonella sp.]|jgi:preprotein translocase subunit SecF|uniref:protein translocase subunit SecF n=1 Tax=Dokdonella sp. TaxID=2291710 RepID=UPI001B50FB4F|nr:protein translocase subunit SecF [Dokdonella sp.]MBK8124647.1 protein translocase subunit SecF [Dokdonella sp.]MBP6326004.1 protein translocase subunit SecF [Dokdonella sp.]MBP6330136.1 protein translocase subunit SecF [Dokdonella sp.]HNV09479.1 protein translocase subunit SecF [Dokdonella sp.]HPW04747.1 protein translocase subunit SecF [Dokdonella sp.]